MREGTDAKADDDARASTTRTSLRSRKDPAPARDLYQHGKLRVDGDVRLAHKLGFFKDL